MSVYEYIIGAILIVASLLIIFVVLLQEGRQAKLGVISGAADSFMDKGAAKTLDAKLAKWTKFIAIGFFVLVLGGMLVTKFLGGPSAGQATDSGAGSTTSSTASQEDGKTNDAELDFSGDSHEGHDHD